MRCTRRLLADRRHDTQSIRCNLVPRAIRKIDMNVGQILFSVSRRQEVFTSQAIQYTVERLYRQDFSMIIRRNIFFFDQLTSLFIRIGG